MDDPTNTTRQGHIFLFTNGGTKEKSDGFWVKTDTEQTQQFQPLIAGHALFPSFFFSFSFSFLFLACLFLAFGFIVGLL